MSDETKPDPWDELMEVAHTYAVDSYEDSKVCENCLGEWPHFEPEQHEPDCPVRPGRENPYAGLVEAAESVIWTIDEIAAHGEGTGTEARIREQLETALAKVRGDG